MKAILLSLITLTIASEAFAQRRPPQGGGTPIPGHRVYDQPGVDNGRPGRGGDAPRDHRAPSRVDRYDSPSSYDRRDDYRYDPSPTYSSPYYRDTYSTYHYPSRRVVEPRYRPNRYSNRYIRTTRRPQIVWTYGFGYQCNSWNELTLNGRPVHAFRFNHECSQALIDIRNYGDFCDREDLYDQSGILEAQFTYSYECREALGWYY